MPFSIRQKQNCVYLTLVILTILASVITYKTTQKKWLLLNEAETKFNEKSFKEAIVLYQKSLAEGPTTNQALLNLATSYVAIGNFSEGIKYYRLYLNLYPKDRKARLLLARTLSWNGDIKEAEEEYRKLMEESNQYKQQLNKAS